MSNRGISVPQGHTNFANATQAQRVSVSIHCCQTLSTASSFRRTWTGMAVHGDLLAVYRGVRQFPVPGGTHTIPPHYEVCRVGADHQITTVWNYEDFPGTVHNATGTDIDTPTNTLFCQTAVGSNVAEVRSLTERGLVATAALGQLRQIAPDVPDTGLGWHYIAPC
jgi:hypothetical protein